MCAILHFLCEDVRGIDDTDNVCYKDAARLVAFAHHIVSKVNVLDAFRGAGACPVDTCLIVIVNCGAVAGVWHV